MSIDVFVMDAFVLNNKYDRDNKTILKIQNGILRKYLKFQQDGIEGVNEKKGKYFRYILKEKPKKSDSPLKGKAVIYQIIQGDSRYIHLLVSSNDGDYVKNLRERIWGFISNKSNLEEQSENNESKGILFKVNKYISPVGIEIPKVILNYLNEGYPKP